MHKILIAVLALCVCVAPAMWSSVSAEDPEIYYKTGDHRTDYFKALSVSERDVANLSVDYWEDVDSSGIVVRMDWSYELECGAVIPEAIPLAFIAWDIDSNGDRAAVALATDAGEFSPMEEVDNEVPIFAMYQDGGCVTGGTGNPFPFCLSGYCGKQVPCVCGEQTLDINLMGMCASHEGLPDIGAEILCYCTMSTTGVDSVCGFACVAAGLDAPISGAGLPGNWYPGTHCSSPGACVFEAQFSNDETEIIVAMPMGTPADDMENDDPCPDCWDPSAPDNGSFLED